MTIYRFYEKSGLSLWRDRGKISVFLIEQWGGDHTCATEAVFVRPICIALDPSGGTLPGELFVGIMHVSEAVAARDVGVDHDLMLACGDNSKIPSIGRICDDSLLYTVNEYCVDSRGEVRYLDDRIPILGAFNGKLIGNYPAVEG